MGFMTRMCRRWRVCGIRLPARGHLWIGHWRSMAVSAMLRMFENQPADVGGFAFLYRHVGFVLPLGDVYANGGVGLNLVGARAGVRVHEISLGVRQRARVEIPGVVFVFWHRFDFDLRDGLTGFVNDLASDGAAGGELEVYILSTAGRRLNRR